MDSKLGRPLKVAMIGAGGRANSVIYPSFADLRAEGKVDIVGICDIDPERLHETADRWDIKGRYGDNRYVFEYQRMIDETKPDAVVAVGQPHIMYDMWLWCINKGCHLYIEKPMGLSIHQARALNDAAIRQNIVTQVSLQRRYSPMVTLLRNEALKRGEITHAIAKFIKSDRSSRYDARDHMMDDTVHAIDTLRWIMGSEVETINSVTRRIDTFDINYIMAQLTFKNGAVGHIINNWTSGKRMYAVEIHSPGIYIEAEHETKGYLYSDGNLTPKVYDVAECAGSNAYHVHSGVYAAASDFVKCCLNGGQPMCNFSETMKTMKVAEIILAQSLLTEPIEF